MWELREKAFTGVIGPGRPARQHTSNSLPPPRTKRRHCFCDVFVCCFSSRFIFFLWGLDSFISANTERAQKSWSESACSPWKSSTAQHTLSYFSTSVTELGAWTEATASCRSALHHSRPIRTANDITMKRSSPASPCFFSLLRPRLRLHRSVASLALLRLSSAFFLLLSCSVSAASEAA